MGAEGSKSGGYLPPDQPDNVVSRGDHGPPFEDDNVSQFRLKEPLQRQRSTMVVVNRGASLDQDAAATLNQDPLMKKLEELHFFKPIIVEKSGLFGSRRPTDIQSKIDSLPALKIVRIYEDQLKRHAEATSNRQNQLKRTINEADVAIAKLLKSYSDRAKLTAKSVERMSKMDDLKRNLSKCQEKFNECLHIVELLNNMLPEGERLEPLDPWAEADEEGSECKET